MESGRGTLFEQHRTTVENLKSRLKEVRHADRWKLDSDFYLFQWLKSKNFDVETTEKTIVRSFSWRQENDISTATASQIDLLEESQLFPFFLDGSTKSGNFVVSSHCGKWDLKKHVCAGHSDRVLRYFGLLICTLEDKWIEANRKLYEDTSGQEGGKPEDADLKRAEFIINIKNWAMGQMSSKRAIDCYLQATRNIVHFPSQMFQKLWYIEVPSLFYVLLKMVKPLLPFEVEVFNDKALEKWKKKLEESFQADTIRLEFGGTKVDS